MTHRRLWISAAIITVALIVGFVISVPHTRDISQTSEAGVSAGPPPITLDDTFKKGVHTIKGTIETPDVCTSVTAQAVVSTDAMGVETIVVEISMPKSNEVCLQLPSKDHFSVTVSAPANVPITATVNGSVASTTVL